MRKTVSMILLVLSLLIVILAVAGSVYAIYDINRISNDLANNPSASGIDYFGIGWGYGIILFLLSAFGLILTAVNIKLLSAKALRNIAIAEVAVLAILIIVSVCIFTCECLSFSRRRWVWATVFLLIRRSVMH